MATDNDSIYSYKPSLAASILFTVLYFGPSIYHLYALILAPLQGKFQRSGHFTPLLIGAFLEVFGYGIRCASLKQPDNIPLYAVSATLIVIAPVFVCASLYLLMDRLIWTGDHGKTSERSTKSLFIKIRRRWLPRIFVSLDVISCLTQASGSGIASSGDWEGSQKDTGTGVLIGGVGATGRDIYCFFDHRGIIPTQIKACGKIHRSGRGCTFEGNLHSWFLHPCE
ncbi:hypothetical protein N7533_013030 [Penicillium manginii]|uniref:uncharacterized protein n=1 Tax=Penicillium manginii TaxID=203109 RepID=UPI002546CECC|nr:uncharacterized protein N7533_013030 [Penicillium manginii]KAJ5734627.1 hypothetical protein N7533_013030 [Penicillium manginii]